MTRKAKKTARAAPYGRKSDRITPTDVFNTALRSGPVKTWANMTEAERKAVLQQLKGGQK